VHATHIFGKLKVAGRTEALATAAARGLISLQIAVNPSPEALAA
jgi:DNA-binding CsgD family transcriptional regulator